MSAAISTSKPTTMSGCDGIGLDERRAAFGIARPAELPAFEPWRRTPAGRTARGRPGEAGRVGVNEHSILRSPGAQPGHSRDAILCNPDYFRAALQLRSALA